MELQLRQVSTIPIERKSPALLQPLPELGNKPLRCALELLVTGPLGGDNGPLGGMEYEADLTRGEGDGEEVEGKWRDWGLGGGWCGRG